jgi:hypothetical protein
VASKIVKTEKVLAKALERPYAHAMQRVFVSDSFAVLQEAVVTAVKTVKDADPLAPVSVIVPSTLLATRLRRAIAWAGQGHFGLRLCTLTDFARDVAEDDLLRNGLRPLPALAALCW